MIRSTDQLSSWCIFHFFADKYSHDICVFFKFRLSALVLPVDCSKTALCSALGFEGFYLVILVSFLTGG